LNPFLNLPTLALAERERRHNFKGEDPFQMRDHTREFGDDGIELLNSSVLEEHPEKVQEVLCNAALGASNVVRGGDPLSERNSGIEKRVPKLEALSESTTERGEGVVHLVDFRHRGKLKERPSVPLRNFSIRCAHVRPLPFISNRL
jgi:hypothetical protein